MKHKKSIVVFLLFIIIILAYTIFKMNPYTGLNRISQAKNEDKPKSSAVIYGETIEGVHKSGTLENFAKDMPLGTLVFYKDKINTNSVGNDGYELNTNGNANIQKYYYKGSKQNLIAYKGPNGNGIPKNTKGYITNKGIDSSAASSERTQFTMKFNDVVLTQSSEYKDVLITISNIYITNNRSEVVPIFVGWQGSSIAVRPLDKNGNLLATSSDGVAMKCDISFCVLNDDGTPLEGESILFETIDLDVADMTRQGSDNLYYPKINDERYTSTYGKMTAYNTDYRESLLVLSGALSDAYMPSTNWLEVKRINEGSFANGLRFSSYKDNDNYTVNTGFLAVMDSSKTKFRWYGSSGGSSLSTGLFTLSANHKIIASSSEGGKIKTDFNFNTTSNVITDSDDTSSRTFQHTFMDGVDVNYIMEAKENHKLNKIKVDNVEFVPSDFETVENGDIDKNITITKNSKNYKFIVSKDNYGNIIKATYTFEKNESDHTIEVVWEGIPASLIIKYLEKGSNRELADSVTKTGLVGEAYDVNSEKKTIENYTFVEDSGNTASTYSMESSITPIQVIFYYNLSNYGYRVEYYYDNVIDNDKTETKEATYGSQITTYTDKLIDGYKRVSTEGLPLTISNEINNNVIKIYYEKRNDLGYTVYYKEQNTNKELKDKKEVSGKTFGDKITENAADIEGYNKVNPTTTEIEITTGTNEYTFYYTKRNDLTGKVKYYEKGTTTEIREEKDLNNLTYQAKVLATDHNEEIDGYNYDSANPESIVVSTNSEENILKLYYTKRKDLSYKVYYKEEGTEEELSTAKEVKNQTFGTTVTENAIDIEGYTKINPTSANIQITTGTNEHTFYYKKRDDLSYKVNYFEKGTDKKIATTKEKDKQVYKDVIKAQDEVIEISKYKYDSSDKESITIDTDLEKNIINLYYTKKGTGLVVKYVDEYTGNEIAERTTKTGTIDEVYTSTPKEIEGYDLSRDSGNTSGKLTEEEIEVIYYYKAKSKVITKHIDKITGEEIIQQEITNGHEGDAYTSKEKEYDIDDETTHPFKEYDLIQAEYPSNSTGTMKKETITVVFYYIHKSSGVKVKHIDVKTNQEIADQEKIEGHEGDAYTTREKEIEGYDLVTDRYPSNASGNMKIEEIVVNYYYIKKTQVIIKHIDKLTEREIIEQEVKNGHEGDTYQTSGKEYTPQDESTLPFKDYTLVEEPNNKEGTMTKDTIIVKYYYAHNSAGVVINHLDVKTNRSIATQETKNGHEGDSYTTKEKEIEGYDLVTEKYPENATGKMTKDLITVNYYYIKKTKVTAKYIDKNTNEEIADSEKIEGHEGDNYNTETKDIENYVLVEEPGNKSGTMTAEPINVIYYYVPMSSGVIEKHIDEFTQEVLDSKIYSGNEGDTYTTSSKEFEGYELDSTKLPTNAEGTMTKDPIEVKYYYRYKTKVVAKYVDKVTGQEIVPSIPINGYEGEDYRTEKKEYDEEKEETIPFKDYVLIEEPENKEGKMTKNPITVTYYYIHKSAGVKVNHLDVKTNQPVAEQEKIRGNEGDDYTTHEKDIENYDLVTDRYPNNAEGKMKIDEIVVNYYYIKKGKITVKYIDKITGKELTDDVVIEGHEGDNYETEEKSFDEYTLEKVPENAKGNIEKNPQTVTYYYIHKSAGVKVNHYDVITGEKIAEEEKIEGQEGDNYDTKEKEIDGYDLVKDSYPENAKGKMTVEETKVNYYYIHKAKVTVKYIDKITGKELTDDVIIEGHEGENYETEEKKIDEYTLENIPNNAKGVMKKEDTEVIYYYLKNTGVTAKYVDKETGKEIEEKVIIKGHEGEEYKTNKKDIKNYILIEEPKNKEGNMTKDPIDVIYYYRQAIFNLSIDKQIKEIQINGETKKINKDIAKVEVKRKKIKDTEVKVVYTIKVTNDGEIEGNATIEENIPEGMIMLEEDNKGWNIKENKATIKTNGIKPGESIEYTVVLTWDNSNENFGTKKNIVTLTDTKNVAGFDENETNDNTDDAQFIITVSTGAKTVARAAGITTIVLSAIGVCIVVIKRKTKE